MQNIMYNEHAFPPATIFSTRQILTPWLPYRYESGVVSHISCFDMTQVVTYFTRKWIQERTTKPGTATYPEDHHGPILVLLGVYGAEWGCLSYP